MKQILFLSLLISTLFSLSLSELCNHHDKKALLQIKQDFGNPYLLASWKSDTDCCTQWYQVECDSTTHRIISLTIFAGELSGEIPPAVGDLPYLQTLEFHKLTNVTGPIQPAIAKLKSLNFLRLSWLSLTGSVPDFLSQLKSLTLLDLAFNSLSGSIPSSLALLPNLGTLHLDRNKLTGSIPESFGAFQGKVPYLYLSHNQLSGKIPASLGKTDFNVLDFSRNRLEGDASVLFGPNKTTQIVDLSRNLLTFDLSKVVFPSSLTSLDLNHNKIYGNIPQQMTQLTMQLLNVSYNRLCGQIPVGGKLQSFDSYFGEAAALCIQKQYVNNALASQNMHMSNEDRNLLSTRNFSSEDVSPRQLKHAQGNNLRDIPGAAPLGGPVNQPSNGGPPNLSFYNTPSPMTTQLSGVAPPPLCRNAQPNNPNTSIIGIDNSPKSIVNSNIQAPRRKFVDEGKLRKISGRLFSDSGPRRSTRLAAEAGTNSNASATLVAANGISNSSKHLGGSKLSSIALRSVTIRKGQSWGNENCDEGIRNETFDDSNANIATTNSTSSPSGDARSLETEAASIPIGGVVMSASRVLSGALEILGLLRVLGDGYRLSCLYRCQDALDIYMKLPHKHYNTGWVLSQVGKAYFELVDYLEAARVFSLSRRASPYSLEGLDIYSTVLYHLKEDMQLSYLAQELISTDRLAPQSWCAMGNCYSLQKDHETALKNFQRAVQLNSRFAYAHTLCGHEYVALEDFENGIKSYQSALRIDARHYNSWYGLGMVYLRQEKFEFSEHHFRMAFRINPCSSVIMSYLGTALHALKKNEEALEMMERAILADKKNPLPMYQKANILVSLESFDEALEVLEELKEYAPRESSVYALMGKIYKRRNMHEKAMLHFGLALDLKPSATDVATIKAAIEKLHVPDEIEDNL